jgi:S1-C subfamily serine protease
VNPFDALVALIVVVAVIVGYRSGVLTQALGLAGAALGVIALVVAGPTLQPILAGYGQPMRALLAVGGALLLVAGGDAIGSTVGAILAQHARGTFLQWLDRGGGALFGLGQGIVIAWLVAGLVATGPFPTMAAQAQRSTLVRGILTVLPPPSDVLGEVGQILDASGFPQVFVGLEPPPAAPVPLPDQAEADSIAQSALRGTVKVESPACGKIIVGTGFAVRPGYVVTNAHVVAGALRTYVTADLGGTRVIGQVVLFDPELDVAVIHVASLPLHPLQLATQAPTRGALGAALGHPEGGPLTTVPAAVTAQIQARGRDLYGRQIVTRSILELHASILPGDSGGPLVLADGTVGGVIFADSRTDPSVGYALDPAAVAIDVQAGVDTAGSADVGPCLP